LVMRDRLRVHICRAKERLGWGVILIGCVWPNKVRVVCHGLLVMIA
jgi:hypothetical protein